MVSNLKFLFVFVILSALTGISSAVNQTGCGWTKPPSINDHPSSQSWPIDLSKAKITMDCQLMCKGDCQKAVSDNDLKEFDTLMQSSPSDAASKQKASDRIHHLVDSQKSFDESLACYHCRVMESTNISDKALDFLKSAHRYNLRPMKVDLALLGSSGFLETQDGVRIKWFLNEKGNFGFVEFSDNSRIYLTTNPE